MHPQPRVRFVVGVCTRVFTAEAPETSGIPHAMVLTAYIALSPGTGLFCPRHFRGNCFPRKLSASVGAPGPHVFAVRISIARLVTPKRPSHPAPNVRDDRDTPLLWRRDGANNTTDFGFGKSEIFFRKRLDRGIKKQPVGQISWTSFTSPRACGERSKPKRSVGFG